jgi:hypothetical protein
MQFDPILKKESKIRSEQFSQKHIQIHSIKFNFIFWLVKKNNNNSILCGFQHF